MDENKIKEIVRKELAQILGSDKYVFTRNVEMANGRNIQVGKGTGTVIATEADQKLAFFGGSPRVQLPTGYLVNPSGGSVIDVQARASINDINNAFVLFGLSDSLT